MQVFCVAYAFMTGKTEDLYEGVLDHVKQRAIQLGGEPRPTKLISDYELAIMNAMTTVFPTGNTQGCFFHFSQV